MADQKPSVTNILIIEDSRVDQLMMIDQLMRIDNVCCYYASSWKVGFGMLPSAHVVVLDLSLPDVQDIEQAMHHVTTLTRLLKLPTVVWSGTDRKDIIDRCNKLGVVAYLVKDRTSHRDLRAAVEEAISQTRFGQTDAMLARITDSCVVNPATPSP